MTAALHHYQARMRRVLDHIDRQLDADLDLETVSGIAAFSKFHFHRQFRATFGLSLHHYVQLARMRRASYRLTDKNGLSITQIALEAGYDAPDAFARAFRRRFGQSPSSFRTSPDWAPWFAAFAPLDTARTMLMHNPLTQDDVTIRVMPPTPVAILEHRGDPATLDGTIEAFVAWRKSAGLSPLTNPTFTIFRSERRPDNPLEYSVDLCVGTDRPIAAADHPMKAGIIPGGRCAVLRVVHDTHDLERPALYLYRDWLPASGEEARDFPIYCQRHLAVRDDGVGHAPVADLFLPLAG
ncbi:AraC family transcriptional regulator [Sphingomonas sp.]|uniref:AraC family transcriptional regulator n=1 Tax=Sphingomonas sp. TaxID=28214 RepID=UPI003B3A7490